MSAQPAAPFAGRPTADAIQAPYTADAETVAINRPRADAAVRVRPDAWPLNNVVDYLLPAIQRIWPRTFAEQSRLFALEHGAFRGIVVGDYFAVGQFDQVGGGWCWGTGFYNGQAAGADPRVTLASAPCAEGDTAICQLVGALAAYCATRELRTLYAEGRQIR